MIPRATILLVCLAAAFGQNNKDCVDKSGRRYLRGQSWQSGCDTFQCEFDGVRVIQKGCAKADRSCFYEGETYQYHCFTYRCDIEGDRAVRREIYAGCTKADGTCYAVGEKYSYFCYEYTCTKKGGLPRREMLSQACSYFERCIGVGETIQHGRRQYRCTARTDGQLVWDRVESEFPGCYTESGALVPEGGTKRDECSLYRCRRTDRDTFGLKIESTGCKNARDECVDVGTTRFECYVDGKFETNCICRDNDGGEAVLDSAAAIRPEASKEVSGENLRLPDHCVAPGTGGPMAVGTVVVYECSEYICEQGILSDNPQLRVLGRDCRTAEGRCIRPGTRSFPCYYQGIRQEKCMCSVGKDGEVVYSVMPESCAAPDGTSVKVGNRHMIDCVTYRCSEDGSLVKLNQAEERGCKSAEGRCVRLGADNFACNIDGVRSDRCKCILNMKGEVEYLVDMMKPLSCKAEDGTPVEEGQMYAEKCTDYRCIKTGDRFDLVPIKTECQTADDGCVPVGSENFSCLLNGERATCRCHVNDDGRLVYTEHLQQTGCLSLSGKFLREGEKEEIECAFHVCRREGKEFKLMPHSVECRTSDGRCVKPGTRGFPCMIGGRRHAQCQCDLSRTGRVQYKPLQQYCVTDSGEEVALGYQIRVECADYKCVQESGRLLMKLQGIECRTSSGECLAIGSQNFPCTINGVDYDDCKCSLANSGDVRYTTKALEGVQGCQTSSGGVLNVDQTQLIDCITYQCIKEGDFYIMRPKEMQCKTAEGSCVEVGSVGFACDVRGTRYQKCRCDMSGDGQLLYSALATECTALDGTKVQPGDTYRHHCSEYKCVESGDALMLDLINRKCRTAEGTCVAVGTPQFPCRINDALTPHCTCRLDEKSKDMIYYKNGCDFRGQFLLRDEKKTIDCIEYQCRLDGDDWLVSPINIECQTADKTCVPVGSENFPCLDNDGKRYDSCQCNLDDSQKVVYSLRQSLCPVDHLPDKDVFGSTITVGQSVTSQCVTYTCQAVDGGLELSLTNIACKTRTGECKPLGTKGFPCQLGDHCTCERVDNSIQYSVYGCYLDGHHMYPGDYKEANCTEYQCTPRDGGASKIIVSQQIGCPGHDGTCFPVGSAPFSCQVQGTSHDNCRCQKGPDGKLGYVITETAEVEPTEAPVVETEPAEEKKKLGQKSDRRAGLADGSEGNCYFPFTHDGTEYTDCIKAGDEFDRPWCPVAADYESDKTKIGYCFPKTERKTKAGVACAFPFSYDGTQYYDCIYAWTGDWCATTADYDQDGEYGKCA